jgi:hypothetical protein
MYRDVRGRFDLVVVVKIVELVLQVVKLVVDRGPAIPAVTCVSRRRDDPLPGTLPLGYRIDHGTDGGAHLWPADGGISIGLQVTDAPKVGKTGGSAVTSDRRPPSCDPKPAQCRSAAA